MALSFIHDPSNRAAAASDISALAPNRLHDIILTDRLDLQSGLKPTYSIKLYLQIHRAFGSWEISLALFSNMLKIKLISKSFHLLSSKNLSRLPSGWVSEFNLITQFKFVQINHHKYSSYTQIRPGQINHSINLTPSSFRLSSSRATISKPFLLADIGEGITGCEIVKWLVTPGQVIAEFDPIAEVQSDKATVEITSPYEGTIENLLGEPGQVVKVGEPLCTILTEDESSSTQDSQQSSSLPSQFSKDQEQHDEQSFQFQNFTLPSEDSTSTQSNHHLVHSTPAVRRLAREHQLDISTIKGNGKQGRVTKDDVLAYLATQGTIQSTIVTNNPTLDKINSSIRVPLGPVRHAMFRAMSQSLKIPHFGYYDQIDVTQLERLRHKLISIHPDTRITLLSLFVKILGKVMAQHALFRSTISTDEPPQFIQRPTCDISIALASQVGLLTPLIPSVDSKTVVEIANHIVRLREFVSKASGDKIPRFPEDLGGNRSGTMTLSNIGIIGGTYTHPVIPPTGQLAIGAIGSMRLEPRYRPSDTKRIKQSVLDQEPQPFQVNSLTGNQAFDGLNNVIEPRLIVQVSFTADHRVVEGVELARLVQTFKEYCESPEMLISQSI
ncbi:hypothetical protein O181_067137 [Austropuccinia psidii MF-1]|uniref:Dihydrolipoamide acetyltransferase component of pyruvate dehydrogenase complex n=1 Tax=Austropuccinia psidii MF-1 TaxID=1389203 RepID=A0A9Q3EWS3_9BASI|nr:hypothetical protein [Austropuccinia psidii MF-1]